MFDLRAKMRKRFRFSLRSLMVVVTLLCVWMGYYLDAVRRQRQAVQAIRALNGRITYDYDLLEENGIEELKWKRWMRSKLGAEYVAQVDQVWFTGREIEPIGMGHYAWPKSEICDDDLELLENLPALTDLCLIHTHVTDRGVPHLKRLKSVKRLCVSGTRITPTGIAELRRALPHCVVEH